MSYQRVIPRDFFNESTLLKCMGQLSLKILECKLPEGLTIEIEKPGEPFDIRFEEMGEFLMVYNYKITINKEFFFFYTRYNGRGHYPFYCFIGGKEIEVFDDNGEFTPEFYNLKDRKYLNIPT